MHREREREREREKTLRLLSDSTESPLHRVSQRQHRDAQRKRETEKKTSV
jgi:hypothetical protein